jgi:hypothetical protein
MTAICAGAPFRSRLVQDRRDDRGAREAHSSAQPQLRGIRRQGRPGGGPAMGTQDVPRSPRPVLGRKGLLGSDDLRRSAGSRRRWGQEDGMGLGRARPERSEEGGRPTPAIAAHNCGAQSRRMLEQLEGTGITMVSPYRGLVTGRATYSRNRRTLWRIGSRARAA